MEIIPAQENDPNYIALDKCIKGHVYKIYSRNLSHGVFNGSEGRWAGFIGIREKFGDRYLFTEFHWDTGEPYGTVKPVEDLGPIPEGIKITTEDNEILFNLLDNLNVDQKSS